MSATTRWIMIVILLVAGIGFYSVSRYKPAKTQPPQSASSQPAAYAGVDPSKVQVTALGTEPGTISRIKFTPDGQFMIASQLTGEVLVYKREGDSWKKQSKPLVSVATAFPGFPPEENGLTGMAFGADFATSGDMFFSYAYLQGEKDIRNRIARAKVVVENGELVGSNLTDIFEGNVPADSSHQIQAIQGVMVQDKPHVLFQMGEGFHAERSQDPTKEAGKLMLIQRDGSNPLGPRPFPDQPKIQAIGFRNPPDLEINQFDPLKREAIVDTGPDQYDRFIYGKFIDLVGGKKVEGLDLGWNGTVDSLTASRFDPNVTGRPDPILYRWDPTHTATNIVFHPGKGIIPESTDQQTSVLVSLFGRTGETGPDVPGRAIWLNTLTLGDSPKLGTWQPFIVRSPDGVNTFGHPLALELDPVTNDLVFIDINLTKDQSPQSTLYWAKISE